MLHPHASPQIVRHTARTCSAQNSLLLRLCQVVEIERLFLGGEVSLQVRGAVVLAAATGASIYIGVSTASIIQQTPIHTLSSLSACACVGRHLVLVGSLGTVCSPHISKLIT
jgi:hypothetical protein